MRPTQCLLQCILAVVPLRCFTTLAAQQRPQDPLVRVQRLDEAYSNHEPLLSLHKKLIEIESITGNEHDVGVYLYNYLAQHNFTVERQFVGTASDDLGSRQSKKKPRFNVLAYHGEKRDTRVLVSSHIDTVPPYWPYETRNEDEIWGRGSVDAKACVATQIMAVEELRASGETKPRDVALLFVVGEETGGDGMRTANELQLKWETVIFGEPTELKLASGHKGILFFNIKAKGKAAHSGYPWLGKNANSRIIPALAALLETELPSSEKYGNSTLNIGRIEGGVAANVIPDSATADVSVRIAEGSPEKTSQIVLDVLNHVDDGLEITFGELAYGPVYIDSDIEGFETVTVNYGTDILNLHGNHKRYLYGPGSILVAHSDHEHLTIGNLTAAVEGYKTLIRHALKQDR
ncbi:MAG: hypothetical protein Q9195_006203 [Heterodermia aff. obscurata]